MPAINKEERSPNRKYGSGKNASAPAVAFSFPFILDLSVHLLFAFIMLSIDFLALSSLLE